jgi:hypothetical protein
MACIMNDHARVCAAGEDPNEPNDPHDTWYKNYFYLIKSNMMTVL